MRFLREISKLAACCLVAAGIFCATPTAFADEAAAEATAPAVATYAGATRYETSEQIVEAALELESSYDGVVIACGSNFPDALSALQLSGTLNYPVLLTETDGLTSSTIQALNALANAKGGSLSIHIVGGTSAVSYRVETQLSAWGAVERHAGATRYETNQAVNAYCASTAAQIPSTIIIATGAGYADALAISPYICSTATPLMLVDRTLSVEQMQALRSYENVVILGGTSAVNSYVEAQATLAVGLGNVTRLAGTTRYGTCSAIAGWELEQGMGASTCGYATGEDFPDALSCGFLLGKQNAALMLTDASDTCEDYATFTESISQQLESVLFFGGTNSLPYQVRTRVTGIASEKYFGARYGADTKLVCIGDSYLEGYTPDSGYITSWGSMLASAIGCEEHNVSLGGTGFSNSIDGVTFSTLVDWAYQRYGDDVDLVVIGGGYNDIYWPTSTEFTNVVSVLEKVQSYWPNAKVYVFAPFWGTTPYYGGGTVLSRTFQNAVAQACSNGLDVECFADCRSWIHGYKAGSAFISSDSIHPREEGQKVIARSIMASIIGLDQTNYNWL